MGKKVKMYMDLRTHMGAKILEIENEIIRFKRAYRAVHYSVDPNKIAINQLNHSLDELRGGVNYLAKLNNTIEDLRIKL